MTVDLHDQLRELCAVIDDEQGSIGVQDVHARNEAVMPLDASFPSRRLRRPWLFVAGAAAFAIAAALPLLVLTSSDEPEVATSAETWSRVSGNEAVFDQGWMSSVTAGGPGLVAVGSAGDDSAAVWTSVDGITWSRVPDNSAVFGTEDVEPVLWSVTAGGPGLVAVGSAEDHVAAVWTSADGLTWSRIAHDDAVFPQGWMTSVTVGGPGLVAVGGLDPGAAVWTSVDGITWSRVALDESVFGESVMNAVTEGGPGLVAVGEDNGDAAVWTSPDGSIWSRVPHDEAAFGSSLITSAGGGDKSMASVTSGGPGLVAVGSDGRDAAVWTSVDGIIWSRVPDDEGVFGGDRRRRRTMSSVIVGGPGLVAVGDDGIFSAVSGDSLDAVVWTSVDGMTWSRVPSDESVFGDADLQTMNSVTVGGSGLVAVGAARSGDDGDAAVWVTETED